MNLQTNTPLWILWLQYIKLNGLSNNVIGRVLEGYSTYLIYQIDDDSYVIIDLMSQDGDIKYCNYNVFVQIYNELDDILLCSNLFEIPSTNNKIEYFHLTSNLDEALLPVINTMIKNYEKLEELPE